MDAMVTARMPQGKKEAGNSILHELGTNPSQFINDVYDYVIKTKTLPLQAQHDFRSSTTIMEAFEFVDSIPFTTSQRFATMTDDEIRQERLIARGIAKKGDFE